MSALSARNHWIVRRAAWSVAVCVAAGLVLFQFWGNATRGYIDTRSLFYWWGIQWFDPAAETQHGPLIVAVALWLLWRNLRPARVSAADNVAVDGRALLAMGGGVALHMAGYAAQQTRLSIVAFLLFTWGVLALAGGRRWAKGAAFPLAFVALAIPVSFVDSLGFNLRLVVTDSAYAIARKAGVALLRNGTQLFSPDGRHQYDVAAACSGIRSLVAIVALALLVGYVSFRSWWARLLLAATSLPYVVAGNLLRVVAIILAGEWAGHATGERVHVWSGPLVFVFVLGLLLATVPLLHRAGFAPADTSDDEKKTAAPSRVAPWAVAAVVGATVAMACFALHALDRLPLRSAAGVRLLPDGSGPVELPAFIGSEWLGRRVAVSKEERAVLPPDTGYSRRNYVSAENPDRQVFFSVVLSGRDRTSIHRPELCLVGQGWTVKDRFLHAFSTAGGVVPATVLRIEHEAVNARGERVVVRSLFSYWFVGSEGIAPTHRGMLWRDAIRRLFHFRADRWAYIVMQTAVDDGDGAALARMHAVLAGVLPGVQLAAPPSARD